MDIATGFQKLMANPTVKKLRAVEQRRMARLTVRKQSLQQTLEKFDALAKEAVVESLKDRAEELKLQADDFLEVFDQKKNLE